MSECAKGFLSRLSPALCPVSTGLDTMLFVTLSRISGTGNMLLFTESVVKMYCKLMYCKMLLYCTEYFCSLLIS